MLDPLPRIKSRTHAKPAADHPTVSLHPRLCLPLPFSTPLPLLLLAILNTMGQVQSRIASSSATSFSDVAHLQLPGIGPHSMLNSRGRSTLEVLGYYDPYFLRVSRAIPRFLHYMDVLPKDDTLERLRYAVDIQTRSNEMEALLAEWDGGIEHPMMALAAKAAAGSSCSSSWSVSSRPRTKVVACQAN